MSATDWLGGPRPVQPVVAVAGTVPNRLPVFGDVVQAIMRQLFGTRRPSPPGDHDPPAPLQSPAAWVTTSTLATARVAA